VIVKKEFKAKEDAGYVFVEGDLRATTQNLVKLNVISFLGAFAAAFCGVGPGFIFGPILLIIGIEP
jgi:hypothetical protein